MAAYDPAQVANLASGARWSVLARAGLTTEEVGTWSPTLVRDPRLLVPMDVQALVVGAADTEPMVRMLSTLRVAPGSPALPSPFDAGTPREPGVHLHWALPDALMRGRLDVLADDADPKDPGHRLQMRPVPDRWSVVRLLCPMGSDAAVVTGWVIEADTARAVLFADYPANVDAAAPAGATVPPDRLTPVIGGSAAWAASYDGTLNRFAFHDPLTDVDAIRTAAGELLPSATYVVVGWWSDAAADPLDGVRTGVNLHARLSDLGWRVADETDPVVGSATAGHADRLVAQDTHAWLGLPTGQRFPVRTDVTPPGSPTAGYSSATDHATFAVATGPQLEASSAFVSAVGDVVRTPTWQTTSTLLHGSILGVPLDGTVAVDARPAPDGVRVVAGITPDDLVAGLVEPGLQGTPDQSLALELVIGAFTSGALKRLGTPDGLADVEQREHAAGFTSVPSEEVFVDRVLVGQAGVAGTVGSRGRTAAQLAAGNGGPLATNSVLGQSLSAKSLAKQGFSTRTTGDTSQVTSSAKLTWARALLPEASAGAVGYADRARLLTTELGDRPPAQLVTPPPEAREITRPGPRWFVPLLPMLAVSGAGRSLRHGGDGRFSPDGLLQCRWPSQPSRGADSVVDPSRAVPGLGSASVPTETLALVREALVTSPYAVRWLATAAQSHTGADPGQARRRLLAEAAVRYGPDASYTGTTSLFTGATEATDAAVAVGDTVESRLVAQELRRFSLFRGVDVDPVGVTAWTQPWIPLWLEWEIVLTYRESVAGWQVGTVDLTPPDSDPSTPQTLTVTGRSLVAPGPATSLSTMVARWLDDEHQRDLAGVGQFDDATFATMTRVREQTERLDVVSAMLEGLREQLLGLPWDNGVVRDDDGQVTPNGAPRLVLAGSLAVTRARLVDAFGRLLELPLTALSVPARVADPADASAVALPPRLLAPSRTMFRLVDAAATDDRPAEASIDQVTPAAMVSPVAGFLLPDHIDESLQVFDTAGSSLGQLFHEPIGGGVVWEIAPGRPGPVDAGPGYGLTPAAAALGWFGAGLVQADLLHRAGGPAQPGQESALSALLRAIDTTLWSYDPFAALGTEHVAGLVGRPVAVVRARLWLEIKSDVDSLTFANPADEQARAAAFATLADQGFPMRVGELTRSDDGLMAYFVGDDFEHVHVVDKVVLELAREAGRHKGYLGPLGSTAGTLPAELPIDHPYLVADDVLRLYPGRTITLTLLLHPAGSVNLTSGVVPRKALTLARDWVAPGLAKMAPYVRSGPVLIDPDKVRLPKVASLAADQLWTRRDSASSWRDDPILSATQAALLPELPSRIEEGYIRVTPETSMSTQAPTGGTAVSGGGP